MEYIMKKLISILLLSSLFCSHSYANENQSSFQKQPKSQNNNQYTEYKAQLADNVFLSFFVDNQEQKAIPVFFKDGKKYQPLSVEFCVKDSDECWRQFLYHNSLSKITFNFDKPENKKDLLEWKIDYIDNNQLVTTDFMLPPKTGALPNGDDDYDPYILWQSDLSNF